MEGWALMDFSLLQSLNAPGAMDEVFFEPVHEYDGGATKVVDTDPQ